MPDDKLNRAPRAGMDFGFPYCHGGDTPDPEFGKDHPCSAFTPPVAKLGAHVAALGMRFYTRLDVSARVPEQYFHRRARFVESQQEDRLPRRAGDRRPGRRQRASEVFAEGWLQPGETVWGRPADVLPLPDGSLLISDDYAGAIYRVTYSAP